jgi:8-oxo-dGTP pyrophosphatase MutT (NUDIX family)
MGNFRDEIREKLRNYSPVQLSVPDRIPAAVIVPFFEKAGVPHLLFTKRTEILQYHGGEICFPGGSRDASDLDLQATALRELFEEVAIPAEQVDVLGQLDTIRTVSSYFLVVPFVGYLKDGISFRRNQSEVEELLEIPFEHFENSSIFRKEIRMVDQQPHPVYYYRWEAHTIWGVTARILKNLLDLLSSKGVHHD